MQKGEFGTAKVGVEYVNFVRNAFRTWMETATLVQDQGERMLNLTLKQGETGYEEWHKILRDWTDSYKKMKDQLQKTVEDNLTKMEEFLSKKE